MKQILVIDDEVEARTIVVEILRDAGYSVLEAGNGEQGVEIALSRTPDLILSDVMMDRLDGFGVIDRIRANPATSTVPFIFMTGLSDKDTMRKGMTLGADDFLTKPFTGSELLSAVNARLTKQNELEMKAEQKLSQLRSCISLALPHEIRTPLAGILGFAEILGDPTNELSHMEIIDYGRLILKAGQRLQGLLENFMIYAQIEVTAGDPRKAASLRKAMCYKSADKIRNVSLAKAEKYKRNSDLTVNVNESAVAISGEYLTKICEELTDNAFKFSEEHTPVVVTTSLNQDEFLLSIADQGRGMTSQQIAELGAYVQFERKFYEQQGAGLGLVIAKRLTEIHGGRMEFGTSPDGGLTVVVHLPARLANE